MHKILENLSDEQQSKLKDTNFPDWMEPMLATLTEDYFDNENWIYERKLDGVRILVFKSGDEVSLMSRNQNNLNDTYPELVDALQKETNESFVADGEVVAFEGNVTSFSKLQDRMNISDPEEAQKSEVKVYLYLFDMMYFSDFDITELPLRDRKSILKNALSFNQCIHFTSHRNEHGKKFLNEACKKRWEGLIAKDAQSKYVHSRSKKWLKFKCTAQQELVIGGYTEPECERIGFGALLLGYYKNGDFLYAGQVGTGFDDDLLESLHSKLSKIERKTNPFSGDEMEDDDVHFVTPKYVAEIGFTEWTSDNKLRHPRFLGLRKDKEPKDVHQEKV